MVAKPKGLAKIWREVKRLFGQPFRGKIKTKEKIEELRVCKSKLNAVFGESNEASKAIGSLLRFYRWKLILGGDIARFLRVPEPQLGRYNSFAQLAGVDLESEISITDEAWILDGIKLPHAMSSENIWEYELSDIVFPAYFRRNTEFFDRYCDVLENDLKDFNEGPYEYENVCLNEGDVVFDCGANMGMFSAVASRYGCEVFAFEAIPDIIDNYLSKTASMNKNIRILNFAVWDKEETLDFSLTPSNIGASSADRVFQETAPYLHQTHLLQNRKWFSVSAITLDAFVEKMGIERIDFIKADIEGAERNMLRGATRILKEFAPKLSICTYHLPDDPQVLREIILEANPKYKIVEKFKKMYAHVP